MRPVAFVVAWRDLGCPNRRDAFAYIQVIIAHLNTIPGDLVVADSPEPFTKARALNAAIDALPSDAIVVQSDADSFLRNPSDYDLAVGLARRLPGLVIPFDRYLYLGEEATADLLAGRRDPWALEPNDCESHGPGGVGNVTVFSRATWEAAGGYDERFGLWGGDDAAFAYAAGKLVAPMRRLKGDVIHLWHPRPPESEVGHPGYTEQLEILAEYRNADLAGPGAVRALVERR